MKLTVGSHTIDKFSEVSVSLRYACIGDTFSFKLYFDPTNAAHKSILKPVSYQHCTISHNGQTLITGRLLSQAFSSSPKKELTAISGYSTTGVLADNCVFSTLLQQTGAETIQPNGSLEFANQSLEQISNRLTSSLNISTCIVDDNVKDECSKVYTKIAASPTQTIEDFLTSMAEHRNVVLSHTVDGRLLYTRSKAEKGSKTATTLQPISTTPFISDIDGAPAANALSNSITYFNSKPIFHFEPGQSIWTKMSMPVNGQKMHSHIHVIGQQDGGNAIEDLITNPYVPSNVLRVTRKIQSIGDDNDTPDTSRTILGSELKAIALTIEIVGWTLNGKLVRPNQIITAKNPECYLYHNTRFFIEQVDYRQTADEQTAVISCVLPEVYNDEDVKNIFN